MLESKYLIGVDRSQSLLLPSSVDEYVGEDSMVRLIDAFINHLSKSEQSWLCMNEPMTTEGGRRSYSPADLSKLFVWGYIERVRSSRRLERACSKDLEAIWLMRQLEPDHTVISRFRCKYAKKLRSLLREFNQLCARVNLLKGDCTVVDGTVLKAANSRSNNHTQKKIEARILKEEARIEKYLQQLREADEAEETGDLDAVSKDERETVLSKLEGVRQSLEVQHDLKKRAKDSVTGQVSTTDPDSRLLKKGPGGRAVVGYLAQSAVDAHSHLISATEVTQRGKDSGSFTSTLKASREAHECEGTVPLNTKAIADSGYVNYADIAAAQDAGFDTYVCIPKAPASSGLYPRSLFTYAPETDTVICPNAQHLKRHKDSAAYGSAIQNYYNTKACRECSLRAKCTKGKYRKFKINEHEEVIEQMRQRMSKEPEIYKLRAATVEHPFGSMLFWNEGRNLLCRGLEKANAEFALSALAYNMKRAVKMLGVAKLIAALTDCTPTEPSDEPKRSSSLALRAQQQIICLAQSLQSVFMSLKRISCFC